VADLRARPLHWVTATSAPCTSLFKPVTVETALAVDPPTMPDNHVDQDHLWWRHEQLHRLALRDHVASLARFGPERDRVEQAWLADPPDGAEAFATADALEERWLADLTRAGLPDRRPGWLRRQWRATDRAAGLMEFAA
jgi:dipeptidase